MAQWEPLNLKDKFPEEVRDIIASVGDVVGPIADILQTTAQLIETFGPLLYGFVNPIATLMQSLKDEITNFIGDLRKAGAYILPVYPQEGWMVRDYGARGTDGFLRDVLYSFDDLADADRPTFSESSQVLGYVFMFGVVDLVTLYQTFMSKLAKLFDLSEFDTWKWLEDPDTVPPRSFRSANSTKPDWKKITVGTMWPQYDELLKALESFVEKFFPGDEIMALIERLAEILSERAELLAEMAATLEELADALENLLDLDVWYIKVGPVAGIEAWKSELSEATNRPPYEDGVHFTAGVVVFTGGPDTDALESLLG